MVRKALAEPLRSGVPDGPKLLDCTVPLLVVAVLPLNRRPEPAAQATVRLQFQLMVEPGIVGMDNCGFVRRGSKLWSIPRCSIHILGRATPPKCCHGIPSGSNICVNSWTSKRGLCLSRAAAELTILRMCTAQQGKLVDGRRCTAVWLRMYAHCQSCALP